MTLSDFSDFIGGRFFGYDQPGSASCSQISIEPSMVCEGSVAFILTHNEAMAWRQIILARKSGAAAVVSKVPPYFKNISCILVENVFDALCCAGNYFRRRLNAKVIAVTGTVGKTTTKDLLAAMLAKKYKTACSPGNMNTTSGLVYSMSLMKGDEEMAVVELGAGKGTDMGIFSRIANPDIVIITNIGEAHLDKFGTKENVFAEKMRIFDNAKEGFAAFLNGDDPLLGTVTDIRGVKPLFFRSSDYPHPLPFAGEHFRTDVAAAAAVARYLGVTDEQIKAAVADFVPTMGRCSRLCVGDIKIILDCYNASPLSMRAALDLLSKCEGRKVAVLGDMLELGDKAAELHSGIGHYVAAKSMGELICIGELAENICRSAIDAGFPKECCTWYPDMEMFLSTVKKHIRSGDTVLLKASRAMRFERILKRIEAEQENGA